VSPEDVLAGKWVVFDMPVMRWGDTGLFAQLVWKLMVQRAARERDPSRPLIPVVCWQDEFQIFATEEDVKIQEVARQARLTNVLLTQNYNVLYKSVGGGEVGRQLALALVANCGNKIFCSQSDAASNDEASRLFGVSRQFLFNTSTSLDQNYNPVDDCFGAAGQASAGGAEQSLPMVQPHEFTMLRRGGPPHFTVECYCYQNGTLFATTGRPWVRAVIPQIL
jgi:hypothetical protein